jgi:hypothetical protein
MESKNTTTDFRKNAERSPRWWHLRFRSLSMPSAAIPLTLTAQGTGLGLTLTKFFSGYNFGGTYGPGLRGAGIWRNLPTFRERRNLRSDTESAGTRALWQFRGGGNPTNGHLIAGSKQGLVDIDPVAGSYRLINAGLAPDGVSVSPDGRLGLPDPSKADGDPNQFLIIATGGSRGDFVSANTNNGTLFIAQMEEVARLSCGAGCTIGVAAAPEPGTIAPVAAGSWLVSRFGEMPPDSGEIYGSDGIYFIASM